MERDEERLSMLREAIYLTDEILAEANGNAQTQLDPMIRAKLVHMGKPHRQAEVFLNRLC